MKFDRSPLKSGSRSRFLTMEEACCPEYVRCVLCVLLYVLYVCTVKAMNGLNLIGKRNRLCQEACIRLVICVDALSFSSEMDLT